MGVAARCHLKTAYNAAEFRFGEGNSSLGLPFFLLGCFQPKGDKVHQVEKINLIIGWDGQIASGIPS